MENSFDIAISEFFKNILENTGGYYGKVAELMTQISGFFLFIVFLGFLFLFNKKSRLLGIVIIASFALTMISNDLIFKPIFNRARPFEYFKIDPPGFFVDGKSFPSGHSSMSAASAFAVVFYYIFINKKESKTLLIWSIILPILVFFIMLSRIALLHHYFTDCLAGCVEGCLIALLTVFITRIILKKLESKKQQEQNQ